MYRFFIASVLLTYAAAAAPSADWKSAMAEPCPRCVAAKTERADSPVPIPERAVVYSFVGEFAKSRLWWLIDLDTGQITKCQWVAGGHAGPTIAHVGTVEPEALTTLRASVARLWRSKPLTELYMAPGAVEDDVAISGDRMVAFNYLDPRDRFMVNAIEAAINAPKNKAGSTLYRARGNE